MREEGRKVQVCTIEIKTSDFLNCCQQPEEAQHTQTEEGQN